MLRPRARRRAGSTVLRLGLAVIALGLAFRIWSLAGSWFYFDDLAFLSAGTNDPLTWHFVGRDYAGHLMPGGLAGDQGPGDLGAVPLEGLGRCPRPVPADRLARHAPAAAEHVRRHPGRARAARGLLLPDLHRPRRRLVRRRHQPASLPDRARVRAACPPRLPAHASVAVPGRDAGLDGHGPGVLREGRAPVRLLRALRAVLVRPRDPVARGSSGCGATTAPGSSRTASSPSRTSRST